MALDGGGSGGGGGPLGFANSFTGPATGIDIYGDFAAAYSGDFGASTTDVVRLDFTTGNYLFVGTIRLSGMTDLTSAGGGSINTMSLSMNGSTVIVSKTDGQSENMPSADVAPLIIPAYTKVQVKQDAGGTDPDLKGTISIIGRIYRD